MTESSVSPYWFVLKEYPATHISASVDDPEGRMSLASTQGKASDANTIHATADNIEALRDKIFVHIGPGKACPDLDGPGIFADDDVIEAGHRDMYTFGRRKARVDIVSTTFHRERHASLGDLLKLYSLGSISSAGQRMRVGRGTKFTIKRTSPEVPGSTVHTGTCELEFAQ